MLVRIATIKSLQTINAGEGVEKRELLVGMQTVIVTMENSEEIPQKTGIRITIQPSNPTARHTQ